MTETTKLIIEIDALNTMDKEVTLYINRNSSFILSETTVDGKVRTMIAISSIKGDYYINDEKINVLDNIDYQLKEIIMNEALFKDEAIENK